MLFRSEQMKETLSAWIDGEASEIEAHRLLRSLESDDGLKDLGLYYQQIKAVARRQNALSLEKHLDLNARISSAIRAEAFEGDGTDRGAQPWTQNKRYASFAVAASLTLAVLAGVQLQSTNETTAGPSIAQPATVPAPSTQFVSQPGAQPAQAELEPSELRELDEEKQRRLKEYLDKHDRSKTDQNARLVNAPPGD